MDNTIVVAIGLVVLETVIFGVIGWFAKEKINSISESLSLILGKLESQSGEIVRISVTDSEQSAHILSITQEIGEIRRWVGKIDKKLGIVASKTGVYNEDR